MAAAHRGPIPTGNARRRNSPTVPTTNLPVSGRKGTVPRVPKHVELGEAGKAYWRWAWSTPQAAAWDDGSIPAVARRAMLEDDLKALEAFDLELPPQGVEYAELLDWAKSVQRLIRTVKSLAGGQLAVMKAATELDKELGLTPQARERLRWKIVEDPAQEGGDNGPQDEVTRRREEREARLAQQG